MYDLGDFSFTPQLVKQMQSRGLKNPLMISFLMLPFAALMYSDDHRLGLNLIQIEEDLQITLRST
jgi:hypothetical protein